MAETKEQHILDIKVSYDKAVQGIIAYQKQVDSLKEKETELSDAFIQGRITENEYKKEMELTKAAISEYNRDIRSLRKEIQNNQRIEKEAAGSLLQKRAILANLTKQYDQLSEAERKNDNIGVKLANDIKQLTEEIKGAEAETERFQRNVGNYTNSITAALTGNSKFASSIMGLSEGGEGFKGMMSNMAVSVKSFGVALMGLMANPVFLALAGIAGAGAAFKWFYDYNKGLVEATRLTKQFTDLAGTELKEYRNQAQAISDTFDVEFRDTLMAANAVAKQFGIDVQSALQLVQDGFVSGADANGEFLDTLKEYPAYFKEAGISADQFVAIVTSATKDGIFSDKGVDAIKEGNLRIREMTTATAAAFEGIGMSATKVQEELRNGQKTTFDIMQEVSLKLRELPAASAEVGAAIADIFGGPGEDAGLQYLQTLADISTNLDETKEKAGELGELQEEQLKSEIELQNTLASLFDLTGGNFEAMQTRVKVFINQSLSGLIKGFVVLINRVIDLYNKSLLIRGLVQVITMLFKNLWSVVSGAFNLIITGAKSVGRSLEGIAYILEGIFTLSIDKAKEGFRLMTSNIGKTITDGYGSIRKAGAGMAQNLIDGFNNTMHNTPIAHISLNGGGGGTGSGVAALPIVGGSGSGGGTGGGGSSDAKKQTKAAQDAAKAAAEARKRELEEIKKAEELLLQLVEKSYEQQRQAVIASYDQRIKEIRLKLETEKNLTITTINAMNQQIIALEKLKQRDLERLSDEQLKKRIEQSNKEISMYLETVQKGSIEEFNLKQQQLVNARAVEEADARRTETDEESRLSMIAAIRAKYAEQEKRLLDELTKAEEEALKKRYEARLLAAKGDESDPYPELTQLRIELEMRKELLDNARQLETESEEEFNLRRLQMAADYQQAKQAITEKEVSVEQAKYEALASMVGGLQEVTEAFGEKSRTLAKMSKVLALAEIAINSGVAIAAGIKQSQSVPYPANLAAIATTVASILSGIASAIKTVKGAKFARGGAVWGEGTATSDSIPARLSNGESVIAAAPTAMFAPLLSAINQLGGGAPIIVNNSPQQQIGEDFLASAVAKGMMLAPRPIVSVTEINDVGRRVDVIENLGTL